MSGKKEHEQELPGDLAVEEAETSVDEPIHYVVVLHNDHYTTMEFVIEVLEKFFQKNHDEAMRIMMNVHQKGRGIAGRYSQEIAETKVAQVMDYAREEGHPLRVTAEPEA